VDRDGKVVELTEAADSKQSMLVFMRGFSGFICPYCTRQTAELVKRHDEILATNTELHVVYPGPAETIPEFLDAVRAYMKSEPDAESSLSVLMDVDLKAVDALGIRQNLSQPCTFVLDADGRLVYEYKGNSPADRPSLDEVLRVLEAASNGSQISGE
jgi:peroxiredoxin